MPEPRICAQNPINGEYTLCGDAFDIEQTEEDEEPHRHSQPGERLTCEQCKTAIRELFETYTYNGKHKK